MANPYISQLLVKKLDFQTGRRCQAFKLGGVEYTSFMEYFPNYESVNSSQIINFLDTKVSLHIVNGSYNGMSPEFRKFWQNGDLPRDFELRTQISAVGERGAGSDALFICNLICENQELIDLVMDTLVYLYTNKCRNTLIYSLQLDKPNLLLKNLLAKHPLDILGYGTLYQNKGYKAPATILKILDFAKN